MSCTLLTPRCATRRFLSTSIASRCQTRLRWWISNGAEAELCVHVANCAHYRAIKALNVDIKEIDMRLGVARCQVLQSSMNVRNRRAKAKAKAKAKAQAGDEESESDEGEEGDGDDSDDSDWEPRRDR